MKVYLDLPETRAILGISEKRANWSSCDWGVNHRFQAMMDTTAQTTLYVSQLLERGVRVLNYAGTYDYICTLFPLIIHVARLYTVDGHVGNHIGNEMWMEALPWSGKKAFNAAQLMEWEVDGKVAGSFKTSGKLTVCLVWALPGVI